MPRGLEKQTESARRLEEQTESATTNCRHRAADGAIMGESTKVTALIKTISKFDGSPEKYWDWKRSTRAIIGLASKSLARIMDGKMRLTAI